MVSNQRRKESNQKPAPRNLLDPTKMGLQQIRTEDINKKDGGNGGKKHRGDVTNDDSDNHTVIKLFNQM